MKHAFLITAYNHFEQLQQLVKALDDPDFDIYIHIDRKSRDCPVETFRHLTRYSKVEICQEVAVYWGGYTQVESVMYILRQAYEKRQYDYYHIISGADLPIKSNAYIKAFFEENKGYEFIDYVDEALRNNREIACRIPLYHPLQEYRRRYKSAFVNGCFTFMERCILVAQLILHVDRTRHLDWTPKYGSSWSSITDDLVGVMMENTDKIHQVFRMTNCSDEFYVQTVAYSCGFADKIYPHRGDVSSNMRFIDWGKGGNGHPGTFTIEDEELLRSRPELFARKFSDDVDKEIIERVLASVRK